MATLASVDSDLERSIRTSLALAYSGPLAEISIVAMNGRVRLVGKAPSYAEKRRVGEIASAVTGVREVINQLRVTPG